MARGEQLETHTCTHALGRRLRRWILSWKLLSGSNTRHWILQALESRLDGYRDVAGGLLSWRDEERAYPSVKCHHPSLPLRAQGRKAEGTGPFQEGKREREGGRKKIEQDQFMIQLCVKEDFPVSRSGLARLKGPTAQSQSFLKKSVLVDYLSGQICFISWRATGFYFLTLQDTLKSLYLRGENWFIRKFLS